MNKQGVFIYTAIAIAACLCISFTNDYLQKRVIRTQQYDIHFYIYSKDRTTERGRHYYWYRSGEIQDSYGSAGGPVLHDAYIKHYASKKLAEKGQFYYGLKTGLWKSWHPNGSYYQETHYRDGRKAGAFKEFDSEGDLLITGTYRGNKKAGKWINHQLNDTTWYQGDRVFKERPSLVKKREDSIAGKVSLWKKIFKKKDSLATPKNKRPSFFKRLFGKKSDTINTKKKQ